MSLWQVNDEHSSYNIGTLDGERGFTPPNSFPLVMRGPRADTPTISDAFHDNATRTFFEYGHAMF